MTFSSSYAQSKHCSTNLENTRLKSKPFQDLQQPFEPFSLYLRNFQQEQRKYRSETHIRKAIVAITPQVWYAWWNCSSLGYIIAASMMIHQPVKNWEEKAWLIWEAQDFVLTSSAGRTKTPAAMEAMVFLFSPQSTLHSQSPHLIPSRNPDILLIWPEGSKRRTFYSYCTLNWAIWLMFLLKVIIFE